MGIKNQIDISRVFLYLQSFVKPKDYEVLETALQRAEAEIRRHIRLEQQMKLYLDTLEEKVD